MPARFSAKLAEAETAYRNVCVSHMNFEPCMSAVEHCTRALNGAASREVHKRKDFLMAPLVATPLAE